MDREERPGGQGEELIRLRWIAAAALVAAAVAFAIAWGPPPVRRAEAWLRYRLLRQVPAPILIGQNGRLFLANHPGNPPGSLITAVCGGSVDDAAVARAAGQIRLALAAARTVGVPVRFLIVPTAPRIYPEDLPLAYAHACDPPTAPAADRLVALLHDPAVIYPVPLMFDLKKQFDVLPRHHFHWAGEGPLRVAEAVAEDMGLRRTLELPLRNDNRSSDLNYFNPGMGEHSRIREPYLHAAGVEVCAGARCADKLPEAIVRYTRPGPGRILVLADSFGDEIGGNFTEYAGQVWLLRLNMAIAEPPSLLAETIRRFRPEAIIIVYHDDGALALDAGSQSSLATLVTLLGDESLPSPPASP